MPTLLPVACLFLATLPQQDRAPFEAAQVQLPAYRPPFRRMLDFDLDGDMDAIGFRQATNENRRHTEIASYQNDGSGRFTEVWSTIITAGVWSEEPIPVLEIGNLDGLGFPDLGLAQTGTLWRFTGNGNGSFSEGLPRRTSEVNVRAMAFANLDSDVVEEWVYTESWFTDPAWQRVVVWNDGPQLLQHGVLGATSLHVLPQDGPAGESTILVAGPGSLQTFTWSPTQFVSGPLVTLDLSEAMVDVGDLDGDGDADAVAFQGGDLAKYRVLRRTGHASWSLETPVLGGPAEFLIDVDGDGDLDGACCGGGGGTPVFEPNLRPTEFQIALNTGGVFAPTFKIPGLGSPQLAGVVDVDGDGDRDLVAGRCVVFVDGAVRAPRSYELPFEAPRSARELTDCDGDGDVDVRFGLDTVQDNDGSGRFVARAVPVSSSLPRSRLRGPGFPGDFDGDGDTDLLVEAWSRAQRGPQPPGGGHGTLLGMALLANDGAGGLTVAKLASAPGVSFAIDSLAAEASQLTDADQDGDLDLLTRNLGHGARTTRWNNDGSGSFALVGTWPGARVEHAEDIDLDGDTDLFVSRNQGTNFKLELYHGPSPAYTLDPTLGTWFYEPHATSLSFADVDGDGFTDFGLASKNVLLSPLLFENRFGLGGAPSFEVRGLSPRVLVPGARVVFGDLDLDGTSESLCGEGWGEEIAISEVMRAADFGGTNGVLQLLPAGLLVDLDSDGHLDVLGRRVTFHAAQP
jgi:hypothetical protein